MIPCALSPTIAIRLKVSVYTGKYFPAGITITPAAFA